MTDPKPLPSRAPRTWPAWLGIGALVLLARLPYRLQRGLGRVLGAILFWTMRDRRRFAARNLELCLPELDAPARAALLRANFRSLGIGTFEFLRAWWGSLDRLPERSSILGIEHLEAARAAGRGVLMLSGHFHSFELCGRLLTTEYAAGAMYRPHAGKIFDWAVHRGRARYASALFERDEIRAAIRFLRKGGVLWYAPDQDMRGRESVFAPFFGVSANTITGTRDLARVGNAAVVPFKHHRKPDGSGYEIELLPALEDFPSDDATRDAARINAVIEDLVRYAPDEYLWIHRRFKRRPPGEPKVYD